MYCIEFYPLKKFVNIFTKKIPAHLASRGIIKFQVGHAPPSPLHPLRPLVGALSLGQQFRFQGFQIRKSNSVLFDSDNEIWILIKSRCQNLIKSNQFSIENHQIQSFFY